MAIPKKKLPDMEETVHKVTKQYSLFGFYLKSEEELALAYKVTSSMLEFIQSQGLDIHFRRKLTLRQNFDFEKGEPLYILTMRAALLPSDTEIGKQYDHSNGPIQINLTRDTKEEVACYK